MRCQTFTRRHNLGNAFILNGHSIILYANHVYLYRAIVALCDVLYLMMTTTRSHVFDGINPRLSNLRQPVFSYHLTTEPL